MTFNVQHFHPYQTSPWDTVDVPLFAEAIKCFNPDILALNEVRGEGPHPLYTGQTAALAGELGYNAYFARAFTVPGSQGPAGPYGNAILSRFPLLRPETVPIPDVTDRSNGKWFEPRAVAKADVLLPDGGTVTVLATHFGLNLSERVNAVETVCGILRDTDGPVILAGDFNDVPDAPVLEPIRARLKDTADRMRFEELSHPSDRPDCKIDYVFCSKDWDVLFAHIPPLVLSDHRPYVADLRLKETRR